MDRRESTVTITPYRDVRLGSSGNAAVRARSWPTRARARFAVAEYIEVFYNRRRRHSSLGYRTPAQALTDHHRAATAA